MLTTRSLPSPLLLPYRLITPLSVASGTTYHSAVRTPVEKSLRLQERLKHHFFTRQDPTISKRTKPTPEREMGSGDKVKDHDGNVDLPDVNAISAFLH